MTRPSKHPTYTKSYAIDQIDDVEHLRAVAHRMWEAFFASHQQTAHAIGVLVGYTPCAACHAYLDGDTEVGCDEWQDWQRNVTKGFGSV